MCTLMLIQCTVKKHIIVGSYGMDTLKRSIWLLMTIELLRRFQWH